MRAPLVVAILVVGCGSSPPPEAPQASPKPENKVVCTNRCMEQDTKCHDKCLEDDSPPPEDGEGCGGKCSKALEACVAHCK